MGNSRFSDGFLLGVLIGGAAVFLLGTKKGNKILKAITEEGLDGLSDILENYEEQREGIKPEPPSKPKKTASSETEHPSFEEVLQNGHSATPAKRFFKRNK